MYTLPPGYSTPSIPYPSDTLPPGYRTPRYPSLIPYPPDTLHPSDTLPPGYPTRTGYPPPPGIPPRNWIPYSYPEGTFWDQRYPTPQKGYGTRDTLLLPCGQNDTRLSKHYLFATSSVKIAM